MHNLIANFNRTYNPNVKQNALSQIKSLLRSRDTTAQSQACEHLKKVLNHYDPNSSERASIIDRLLENDIIYFLCEAISNINFELFKSVISCLRLLWTSSSFYEKDHAAQAMSAMVRALTYYAASGPKSAIGACLHFLDDLLNGISMSGTTSALSHQSAYSAVQLLACLNTLPSCVNTDPMTVLLSAFVLDALISYQPMDLIIQSSLANALYEVLKKWFPLLITALNQANLTGNERRPGMFFAVLCQLGIDTLGFVTLLNRSKQKVDFVQTIITDEQEINMLKQCSDDIRGCIQQVLNELIVYTKIHQTELSNEEYEIFLNLMLKYFYTSNKLVNNSLEEFSDTILSHGYLAILPQVQILRNDTSVRKASILLLEELLKVLAIKYLDINENMENTSATDIHMGLLELQSGAEMSGLIITQLQKGQPYGLLIYIYFYCQSTDNPAEVMAPLLPYLVDHVLRLPKSFKPPHYVIKALWLVFAMATISNRSLTSLDERVKLEKATSRLIFLLHPEPSKYYTHNPVILLWAFSSQRIPKHLQMQVVTQWLESGDTLPTELIDEPIFWDILLKILVISSEESVVENSMDALQYCMKHEGREEFASIVWTMLPDVLSRALIDFDNNDIGTNVCYVIDLATTLLPKKLNSNLCMNTAILICAIYSKNEPNYPRSDVRYHFEYVCLKLSLCLLKYADDENDNRVLVTFLNHSGYIIRVLSAWNSADDGVACAALELLSLIVFYFKKNNYQRGILQILIEGIDSNTASKAILVYVKGKQGPKSVIHIQTDLIIQSLKRDVTNERGSALLHLLYVIIRSGVNAPLALAYDFGHQSNVVQEYNAVRALMFRIQTSLCCVEPNSQTENRWKILSEIFKHAIVAKNDTKLVAILTSQPWTNILIQFHLSQNITKDFLIFTHIWLTLLKITLKNSQEVKKIQISKQSLFINTLIRLKKIKEISVEEESNPHKENVMVIVKEILDSSGIKIN